MAAAAAVDLMHEWQLRRQFNLTTWQTRTQLAGWFSWKKGQQSSESFTCRPAVDLLAIIIRLAHKQGDRPKSSCKLAIDLETLICSIPG